MTILTTKEWLTQLASNSTSDEQDDILMQHLLRKGVLKDAVVTCGMVYPYGKGQPLSIHQIAQAILGATNKQGTRAIKAQNNKGGLSKMTTKETKVTTVTETKETKPVVVAEVKKEAAPKAEKPKIDGGYGKATQPYMPARIQLKDGKVVAGIRFLRDVAKLSEKDSTPDYSASYWLGTTQKGVDTLKKFDAKIVYGIPLTPKEVPPKPALPAKAEKAPVAPKAEKSAKTAAPAKK